MKILIILCSEKMDTKYLSNIEILKTYMNDFKVKGDTVDYAGISCEDDFSNYETAITFKYKMVNLKKQLTKVCEFVESNIDSFDYDWYIKFRPDIKLLQQIDFSILSDTAINSRARLYVGPKSVKYGCSVGGEGCYKEFKGSFYNPDEKVLVLDDMVYIFHNNVIRVFINNQAYNDERQDEYFHTRYWMSKHVALNLIGINLDFTKHGSGLSSHTAGFILDIIRVAMNLNR